MAEMSKEMQEYFEKIKADVLDAYAFARLARKKGFDPIDDVEIKLANSMAERVEGLIAAAHPQLVGTGLIDAINELEKKYEPLDWRVALEIARDVALEKFCKFETREEAIEAGIRVGFAYHTLGIVAAPLEGFVGIEIKKRKDGQPYLAVKFAGPIRGAGGTASAVSVLIADYVRKAVGLMPYDPDEYEIKRYATELNDYNDRVTTLQYHPSDEEIEFLIKHIPVELDGDPTETIEVSNYKDLPRVKTNRIRGGMVLVLSMIALKAPKLWKRLKKWGHEMQLQHWDFIGQFVELQEKIKAHATTNDEKSEEEKKEKPKVLPNYAYIHDLVSGRPVFGHPMAEGSFRLRYGRARTSGYSAAAIHPATQVVVNGFIAKGTQLKVERPGKAASITTCTTIEGPIVLLEDGSVKQLHTFDEALKVKNQIKRVLWLGDILFNYGDFSENNAKLAPSGYVEEWWALELEKAIKENHETFNALPKETRQRIERYIKDPIGTRFDIDVKEAFHISELFNIPLHPRFLFFWKLISKEQLKRLYEGLKQSLITEKRVSIKKDDEIKAILEKLRIEHHLQNEFIVIEYPFSYAFAKTLGLKFQTQEFMSKNENEGLIDELIEKLNNTTDVLEFLSSVCGVKIRDKAGTFVGARMGRPEKAKMREMKGKPHVLFPVGMEGGRLRSFQSALEQGKITADFAIYYCEHCKRETIYRVCEICGNRTKPLWFCNKCGILNEPCEHKPKRYKTITLDIKHYWEHAKKIFNDLVPDLIKGVRGTSNRDHVPEYLVKGFIRAKYDLAVNKDGTIRYDASELPLTHFKPKELLGVSIEKLKELGYTHDIHGNPLTSDDQILELKPLDIVLPADIPGIVGADDVLIRAAKFIDELLVKVYGLKPYYNVKTREDLIGHYVIGLAPHISAGTIGRILGFARVQGLIAHPLWHAALRRDCDGDEGGIMLLLDGFINFSQHYLPDKRGARTMDAPLVLTLNLKPTEVDDMVLGLDVVWRYNLEFYEATQKVKMPSDVKIEQLKDRVGTEKQYEGFGFTHDTENFNIGIPISAYKTLPSMEEKLKEQLDVAKKLVGVDENDVARLVIEKHFMKDIKGNLRKFSMQSFRCVNCNEIYRRPPLSGRCPKCGGKLVFTISEGSVSKYLDFALDLAREYDVDNYLKQSLELLNLRISSIFKRQKIEQKSLQDFFKAG